MALYPDAVYKPTPWADGEPRNKQGRGILHVAVSGARSLPPWDGNTWHFYIAKAAPDGSTDGSGGPAYCEQYIDTEYRSATSAAANDDAIGIETAGGLGSSAVLNAEPWTRAQELRIADIMRWEAAQPGGAPLELMPDSKPGRRGWGPHRLGIEHSLGVGAVPGWLVPGGERWSSHIGKECPGDAKVRQIPSIIQLARDGDDMPDKAEFIEWVREAVSSAPIPKSGTGIGPADLDKFLGRVADDNYVGKEHAAEVRRMLGVILGWRAPATDGEKAALEQLRGAAVDVDEQAVAAAFVEAARPLLIEAVKAGMAADNDEQADAIVDRLAERLGSV